jgi:hypothetical protein
MQHGDIETKKGGSVTMDSIRDIMKYGKDAQGKRHLIRHLKGERLTMKQAILANCYGCTGGYDDFKQDCEIASCPLHPFMPYRKDKDKPKRERSEKQVEAAHRLASFRSVARSSTMQEHTKPMSTAIDPFQSAKEV